jgi:2'-5' RNA ligase
MAFRAFVGIPLPADAALASLLDALAGCGADLKLSAPEKLHLTLSFLGDVPDDAAPRLAAALDDAARGAPTFTLEMHGVGAFPNPRRPRVVWAGSRPCPPLDALAARVRAALPPEDDKPFRAHVTLGRVREGGRLGGLPALLASRRDEALPTVRVDVVKLWRSALGPGGARHEALHAAPLEA